MWTESWRRLPTYLLVGGSSPNIVHAWNFFFFEWVQNMLTWGQEDMKILVMHFRGPKVLDLGSCFQKTKDFLGFGSSFQRTKGSGSWLMFSEDQRFWILAHIFKGPKIFWPLTQVFKGPKVLDLGSCFQRTKDSGSWLMFSKDQGFLSFGSCF